MRSTDVVIIGAGAAGLMCAMTAAARGRQVLLIEHSNKAGKKIDWTRIKQWHLQGDWSTAAPFHVMFIALRTRQ